jgi:hypothetical protein
MYETDDEEPLGGGVPPLIPATPEFLTPRDFTLDNGPEQVV